MTATAAFDAGVLLFRDSLYNEAVEKFSEAISLGSQNHIVLDSRAAAYEKLGQNNEALLDSRRVIEQFPDLPDGYSRASRLLTSLGKRDEAVELARKGVAQVKPNDPKSNNTMQAILDAALLAQNDHEQELKVKECHITKVPVEVLALIFEDLVHCRRTSPTALAHVCHLWRDLALSMSSLWCRLVLDDKQEARTAFWLLHSRGRIRQLRATTWKSFSECMSKLADDSSSLLEEIDFDFSSLERVPADFRFQADLISFSWRVQGRLYAMHRLPFEPEKRRLRISELRIVGVHIDWQIEAQRLSNITTLVVENAHLQLFELLMILDRSPHIQTLNVQPDDELPLPPRKERLILASLSMLRLRLSNALLRFIEVPALQTLQLEALHLGEALRDLSPHQPPLVHFSAIECAGAHNPNLPLPDTLQTLRLASLTCNVDRVVNTIAAGKCPRLVELDLSNTQIVSGPIIQLIKTRNCLAIGEDQDPSKPAKLESLTLDLCEDIHTASLPWIRSKVPRVSCVDQERATIRERITDPTAEGMAYFAPPVYFSQRASRLLGLSRPSPLRSMTTFSDPTSRRADVRHKL